MRGSGGRCVNIVPRQKLERQMWLIRAEDGYPTEDATRTLPEPRPRQEPAEWRLRSFWGHELSDEQLARVPGPAIVLIDLREIGVRLSLDDFGTGYSSMTHLRRMPVHSLKIDCSFVAGLGVVAEDTAIVAAIINLGHSFGVEVIAEGIETVSQLRHLARLGCDGGQGFLWSEGVDPLTASALMLAPLWVSGVEVGV